MAFVIRASSMFTKRYLKVTDQGVDFMETAAIGGRRKFNFGQIDFVLLSPGGLLSLQVGNEVFSIQTKLHKPAHRQTIDALLGEIGVAVQRSKGFPVIAPGPRF